MKTTRRVDTPRMLASASIIFALGLSACTLAAKAIHNSTISTSPRTQQSISRDKNGPIRWIIAASGIEKINPVGGSAIARKFFDNPDTFILGNAQSLAGWIGTSVSVATNLTELQAIVSSKSRIGKDVMYDPEHWQFTPLSEQRSLFSSVVRAHSIASKANLNLIVAPAMDLTKVLAQGQTSAQSYISLDIAGRIAPLVTDEEIQAQSLETNPVAYSKFVITAAKQALSANPSIKVYAGLSTNPNAHQATAEQLFLDIEDTKAIVVGYWLNIPGAGPKCPSFGVAKPQVAVRLLQML